MSRIVQILDQFEAKAIEAIRIDNAIKCDNYDNVGRLKLIQQIRKAITSPPNSRHYSLEELIVNQRINF